MNLKELKALNDLTLKNIDIYNNLKTQKALSNYNNENGQDLIKYYHQAKANSTTIAFYKQAFEINAMKLASLIKDKIEKNTGKEYVLDVVLDSRKESELKDTFDNKFVEFYEYSLVLKEKDNKLDNILSEKFALGTVIPVAKNKSSIVASNKSYLNFDKDEAMQSFERKTVNLIGNNPIYIRNFDHPLICEVAKKYNLEDYLWQIVEQEIEAKKEQKNEDIKEDIKKLNEKKKTVSSNDLDFLSR